MSFFGSSGSDKNQLDQIKDSIRQELAMANAQALISKLNEKCFDRCLPSPGSSFTSGDKLCVDKCIERYMDTFNLISRVYVKRVQSQAGAQH